MSGYDYDLIILGAGSGGISSAIFMESIYVIDNDLFFK